MSFEEGLVVSASKHGHNHTKHRGLIVQIASGVLDVYVDVFLLCVPIAACCWSVSLMFLSACSASDRVFTVRRKRRVIRAKDEKRGRIKKVENNQEKKQENIADSNGKRHLIECLSVMDLLQQCACVGMLSLLIFKPLCEVRGQFLFLF